MKNLHFPIEAWRNGILEFNQGNFWKAHEYWEVNWKLLPPLQKKHVQALIQACAAFYLLLEKMRIRAACSLSRSALEKLQESQGDPLFESSYPRIEIEGLETFLSEFNPEKINSIPILKARLLISSK